MALQRLKENRSRDKPFMLMCQYKAPHCTWIPALRHLDLYIDIEIRQQPTLFDRWRDNASPARYKEMEIDRHLNMVCDVFGPPIADCDPDAGVSVDKTGFILTSPNLTASLTMNTKCDIPLSKFSS